MREICLKVWRTGWDLAAKHRPIPMPSSRKLRPPARRRAQGPARRRCSSGGMTRWQSEWLSRGASFFWTMRLPTALREGRGVLSGIPSKRLAPVAAAPAILFSTTETARDASERPFWRRKFSCMSAEQQSSRSSNSCPLLRLQAMPCSPAGRVPTLHRTRPPP
eukprot:COSAG05_NODE_538_length_8854_cov_306.308738_9_plen_163_part_00